MEESFCEYVEKSEKNIKHLKVSVGILIHNDRVLMVQRKKTEKDDSATLNSTLKWQFPTGIIKNNEPPQSTIVKEVFKETGIHCNIKDLLGKRIHPNTKTLCYYYILNYEDGDIFNGDEDENCLVSWVPIEDYQEKITSDIFVKVKKFFKGEHC